jgi:hypothetical protein
VPCAQNGYEVDCRAAFLSPTLPPDDCPEGLTFRERCEHEAAHAVTAKVLGFLVSSAWVSETEQRGQCVLDLLMLPKLPWGQVVARHITQGLAGGVQVALSRGQAPYWGNELLVTETDADLLLKLAESEEEREKIAQRLVAEAVAILWAWRPAVERVADVLQAEREIGGRDVAAIVREVAQAAREKAEAPKAP